MVITDEQAQVATGRVLDFEGARAGMIECKILALAGANSEEPLSYVEGRRDDVFELQVGFDQALVDVKFGFTDLLGVVTPIPRCQLKIATRCGDGLLQGIALFKGASTRRLPYLHKQAAHGLWRSRHRELERGGRGGGKAKQPRALRTQRQDLGDELAIVGFAALGTAADPGLKGLFPEVAPRGELQERLDAGARERDGVLARQATRVRRLGRR